MKELEILLSENGFTDSLQRGYWDYKKLRVPVLSLDCSIYYCFLKSNTP